MFQTLIYPSSGACDFAVELPHWLFCSWFVVCWRFGANGFEWCLCCRLKLLMMDILMSETCWAHKKWNKIASDIKLVFYSSTITMLHGPINIRFTFITVGKHYLMSPFKHAPMPTYSAITIGLLSVQYRLCCMYISLCWSFKWNKLQYFADIYLYINIF